MTQQQCDQFQSLLNQDQKLADKLKDTYGANSDQYQNTERAITSYGQEGVDNGVHLQIGDPGAGALAATDATSGPISASNPTGQNITVTLGSGLLDTSQGQVAIAHEGSHVADAEDWASLGFPEEARPANFDTEYRAYGVTASLYDAMGATQVVGNRSGPNYILWNKFYSAPVNTLLRTTFIKALYPNWNLKAWQQNTGGTAPHD